ncbi:MAG TPA: hypothetical protein VFF21_03530 [Flavobacteriaceae bacterium]|nr:hypothetical protein [Flavobacteriaceae bacterium]
MSFLKRLFGKKKSTTSVKDESVSEESCPFCWGYQDYGNKHRNKGYDKQIDVKNHRDKYVKVGKFMVEHVEGFKRQKRIIERCPKCGGKRIRYKED